RGVSKPRSVSPLTKASGLSRIHLMSSTADVPKLAGIEALYRAKAPRLPSAPSYRRKPVSSSRGTARNNGAKLRLVGRRRRLRLRFGNRVVAQDYDGEA